jgi:hypothetical protein
MITSDATLRILKSRQGAAAQATVETGVAADEAIAV